MITLAIDCVGSDRGPSAVLKGILEAYTDIGDVVHFRLHGNTNVLKPLLKKIRLEPSSYTLVHAPEEILPTDGKRAIAIKLRQAKTSMHSAILDVREGRAEAVVSGGNTGALAALSFRTLGYIDGNDSLAICARVPAITADLLRRDVLLLDQGADVKASPEKLLANARMGALAAQILLGREMPTVRILNVGGEDGKGHDIIQAVQGLLKENQEGLFQYDGFIEGHEILMGLADVAVTDGFTGNVWLKSAEGVGGYIKRLVKIVLKQKPYLIPLFVLALPFLLALRRSVDYNNYNGGAIIGLAGLVVKSHGSAKPKGIARAIRVAFDLAEQDFVNELQRKLTETSADTQM